MSSTPEILSELMRVIDQRKLHPSAGSYTSRLMAGGVEAIGAKVVEEAAEVVQAAGEAGPEGRAHLVYEAADLVYHLLVLLSHAGLGLADVQRELERRFGMSGLQEKAQRQPPSDRSS